MRKRDEQELAKRYTLIFEGIKDIQQMLLAFQNETWYDDAYNALSMRCGDAIHLMMAAGGEIDSVPPAWRGNEKDKPLFTDNDAKHCIKWFKNNTSGNDILLKYIDYKKYNMQQTNPITQFNDFVQFDTFVDGQKKQREENVKTKKADSAANWEPQDIIFENDDLVILSGRDRYSNIRIRAVLSKKTGLDYNYCISNKTLISNLYDTYRFKPHGTSQSFYWLFFKNIPISDRFHICVLGVRKNGTYDWSLRDNATAEVTWENVVSNYKKYGVDLDKPLKGYDGQVIPDVKAFLKYNELTPEEIKDRDLRDLITNKIRVNYGENKYDTAALQNVLENYTTEFYRKLIGDALDVKYIDSSVWEVLNEYCRTVIVNRVPPDYLREELVASQVFKNDTKTAHRYTEMLTRAVKYLPNYLLNIMNNEQVTKQTHTVWQHQKDIKLKVLNVPVYYPSHFDADLLAEYLSKSALESDWVKRPENWPNVPHNSRIKLFHLLNQSVNSKATISEHILEQALHIFINLDHLG
jgi:hypothetical protein